jgi:hypothetical protein
MCRSLHPAFNFEGQSSFIDMRLSWEGKKDLSGAEGIKGHGRSFSRLQFLVL